MLLTAFQQFAEFVLLGTFSFILLASIFITFKTRFIQIRLIPAMFSLFAKSLFAGKTDSHTLIGIPAHRALFTAMATTIGIGNIVGPAIAVRLGGPGALLGFMVALFFGAATQCVEVTYSLQFRKTRKDGTFAGGPMPYIQNALSSFWAKVYAFFGAILLLIWSSNQSNTLADIAEGYGLKSAYVGAFMAIFIMGFLLLGIRSIGALAARLVPFMFLLYSGTAIWIIAAHVDQFPLLFNTMISEFLTLRAASGAAIGLAVQKLLRWGLTRGIHATEAGIGTATIPHSQSASRKPEEQGIMAMMSVFCIGFICLLSGLITLVTGTYNDPNIPLGIQMLSHPFQEFFQGSGLVLLFSVFLFAFGTILGNAYNGSQCFLHLTKGKHERLYFALAGLVVFFGTLSDVEQIWALTDYFIVPVALINMVSLLILLRKGRTLFPLVSNPK